MVWGAAVVGAGLLLVVLTGVWFCCTAKLCRRGREDREDGARHKAVNLLCTGLLILLVLVAL